MTSANKSLEKKIFPAISYFYFLLFIKCIYTHEFETAHLRLYYNYNESKRGKSDHNSSIELNFRVNLTDLDIGTDDCITCTRVRRAYQTLVFIYL